MKVTSLAMRPASTARQCFYCQQAIGLDHKPDCVLIKRNVKIRLTIEYEISVPANWDAEMIEFSRNESSWCSSNAIKELVELSERENCLCPCTTFEYLADAGNPFLEEG